VSTCDKGLNKAAKGLMIRLVEIVKPTTAPAKGDEREDLGED
jgi:hypothetical protein